MEWLPSLLPVTVIAAIGLFILKEIFEWIRRRRTNGLKRQALRTLLARECELNHWALKRLKEAIEELKGDLENGEAFETLIIRTGSGETIFQQSDGDQLVSSWPLPPVQTETMNKNMLDVAILDKQLFETMERAYSACAELRHVRQSLIDFIEAKDDVHLEGFVHYGIRECDSIFEDP